MTRRARALPTANSYHDACMSRKCCSGSPASSRVNNAAVARAASTSSARSLRGASRSERPQNPKRNHPRPPHLETTRVDGVAAAGARCDGVWVSSAAAAAPREARNHRRGVREPATASRRCRECHGPVEPPAAALRRRCQKFARRPRDRPRIGPNGLKFEKETSHDLLSRRRLISRK